MLEQLINLTNSQEYLGGMGWMDITEVHSWSDTRDLQKQNHLSIKIKLEWENGSANHQHTEVWEIACRGVVDSGRLQSYVGHYPSITIHDKHPVLFNFTGAESALHLQGPCADTVALIGALYLAHEQACGHWSKFQNIVFSLADWMNQQDEAELYIPTPLVEAYVAACRQQGISCTVTESGSNSDNVPKLQALIWSQADFHPPDFKLWQPYVVAEHFAEKRLE